MEQNIFFTIDSSSKTFATEWPQETEKEHNQEYLLWPSFKINAAHDEVNNMIEK
jgi:hypothetical protein